MAWMLRWFYYLNKWEYPLKKPFRHDFDWTKEDEKRLREEIKRLKINRNTETLNILFIGQAGGGKSSFINTAVTAICNSKKVKDFKHMRRNQASSCTTKFTAPVCNLGDVSLPVKLYDCRGIDQNTGLRLQDIQNIIKGHIKPGYELSNVRAIETSDPYYRNEPTLGDKMHCVVYVVDAGKCMTATTKDMFKDVNAMLESNDVPQVVLMTKVDTVSPMLNGDVSKVFRSDSVLKEMENISVATGIPSMNVLPCLSYFSSRDNTAEQNKNILALWNIQTMIEKANDFVEAQSYFQNIMMNDH